MKTIKTALLFALVAFATACPGGGKPVNWPAMAHCAAGDVGSLVGIVTQLLFSDAGIGDVSPSGKAKLEELAGQYSAETVLCVVHQLKTDWTAPAASPNPDRQKAADRAAGFLASTKTVIVPK